MILLFLLLPFCFLIPALCHDELAFASPYARFTFVAAIGVMLALLLTVLPYWIPLLLLLAFVPLAFKGNWIALFLPAALFLPTQLMASLLFVAMLAYGLLAYEPHNQWRMRAAAIAKGSLPLVLFSVAISLIPF